MLFFWEKAMETRGDFNLDNSLLDDLQDDVWQAGKYF